MTARTDYPMLLGGDQYERMCDELDSLRAENTQLRTAVERAALDLYVAEVHRQGVGWDDYCTEKLIAAQHVLAGVSAVSQEGPPE